MELTVTDTATGLAVIWALTTVVGKVVEKLAGLGATYV